MSPLSRPVFELLLGRHGLGGPAETMSISELLLSLTETFLLQREKPACDRGSDTSAGSRNDQR